MLAKIYVQVVWQLLGMIHSGACTGLCLSFVSQKITERI